MPRAASRDHPSAMAHSSLLTAPAQLIAHAAESSLLNAVVRHLQDGGIGLERTPAAAEGGACWGAWEQRNYAASRKVVLPLLRELVPP